MTSKSCENRRPLEFQGLTLEQSWGGRGLTPSTCTVARVVLKGDLKTNTVMLCLFVRLFVCFTHPPLSVSIIIVFLSFFFSQSVVFSLGPVVTQV